MPSLSFKAGSDTDTNLCEVAGLVSLKVVKVSSVVSPVCPHLGFHVLVGLSEVINLDFGMF